MSERMTSNKDKQTEQEIANRNYLLQGLRYPGTDS